MPAIIPAMKAPTRSKIYSGWFFKQNQERGFKITDQSQIPYVLQLMKRLTCLQNQELRIRVERDFKYFEKIPLVIFRKILSQ